MNPLVVLLGLGLIVANLLLSPQGTLLMRAFGTGGPADLGSGLPSYAPFARAPGGGAPGGSVPPNAGELPRAPAALPAGGVPELPAPGLPALVG